MSLDQVAAYAQTALQVIAPFRVLAAIVLGAAAYWLMPHAWRRFGLIVISLAVVLTGYQRPVALVACTALVCGATYVAVCKGLPRKPILLCIVALYAALHGLFGLLTFTPWLNWTGLTPEYVLPTIGLTSAFTFLRLIHFTADYGAREHRGRGADVQRHAPPLLGPQAPLRPLAFAAWCLFFPTFVHLPLIRYQAWHEQFNCLPKDVTRAHIAIGLRRIGQAVLKGVVLAIVFVIFNPNAVLLAPAGRSFAELFAAAIVSAITYYVGFSAFVDLGIGAASLFGIALPENFAPIAKMIRINRMRDFWRSWNITTTQWLNDYVFTPLGGYRRHPLRNVMLTMTACGLWHSVSFFGAVWGAGLGVLLLIEHCWNRMRIHRDWPEIPAPIRGVAILCGVALVNLALTPYGYAAQTARALYPLWWLGLGG
jgi:D-alanyl-lipoteichoic acid acyltransferase DltB (MBOAT superfamily)